MKTYLLYIWDSLRGSFWFIPAVLGLAALAIGIAMPILDERMTAAGFEYYDFVQTKTDAARSTLSAVASATTTVAATVFSITVVTLSLASQQFGPRLLRNFMFDFPTQWTLGVFVSTSMYCLLVLRVVEDTKNGEAPHLSTALGVVLAVLSLAMLIVFIHHVSVLIQAPHVVQSVAADLDDAIVRLYPESIGESSREAEDSQNDFDSHLRKLGDPDQIFASAKAGYIQAIDGDGLLALAESKNLTFCLQVRPGDFLREKAPLLSVWSHDELTEDNVESLEREVNEMVIVGMRRTPRQDIECAVDELVEVAVRALSPGVNDPFTAMNCIDYLSSSLCRLAGRTMPSRFRLNEEGKVRFIAARVTRFPNVLATAFDPIRQYGRTSAGVNIRLLEALTAIARAAVREQDRQAVLRQAEMILRGSEETLPEELDRNDVRSRYEEVLRAAKR